MPIRLNTSLIEQALRRLGQVVEYHSDIELLLVGGAAGMLSGLLARTRTTTDCDVMVYTPPHAMAAVELAASIVAQELDLPPNWLNSDVQLRIDTLPDGWKSRRVLIDTCGPLRIFAASRPDLIAMKVIAGRAQDLEDLRDLKLRDDDKVFVRTHLATLKDKGTSQSQIDEALETLEALETQNP
jgi:hypothetical protein